MQALTCSPPTAFVWPRTLCVYLIFSAKSSAVKTHLHFTWMHCNNNDARRAAQRQSIGRCVTNFEQLCFFELCHDTGTPTLVLRLPDFDTIDKNFSDMLWTPNSTADLILMLSMGELTVFAT